MNAPAPRHRRRIVSRVLAASAMTLGVAAGGGYLWLDQTSDVHNLGTTACTTVTTMERISFLYDPATRPAAER
ncbi:hypothetical protein [Nocardia sp. CA-120079]|uniref:hypothetical protein n=1 Tax=Nocardia sp. CA-120079 TaxID=3239974 RepID=UPI003D97D461